MHTNATLTSQHRPAFNPVLALHAAADATDAVATLPADEDDQDWLDFLAIGLRVDRHTANNQAGLPWLRAPVLLSY